MSQFYVTLLSIKQMVQLDDGLTDFELVPQEYCENKMQ